MNLVSAVISAKFTSTARSTEGLATATEPISASLDAAFSDGTSANQANQTYSKDQDNLAASTADTLDLSGSLTDAFGDTITFTRVKALYIKNTGTVNITVGGTCTAVPPAASPITIRPGGVYMVIAPDATAYAVANGSTDQIVITNTSLSTAAQYDLAILGTE